MRLGPKVTFDFDGKHLGPVAFALFETATQLLARLGGVLGDGPWMDDLRKKLETEFKNMDIKGMSMFDEPEAIEASLGAIGAVFDRINRPGKTNSPT